MLYSSQRVKKKRLQKPSITGRQHLSWFFLEADRGTMPVTRDDLDQRSIYRKLLANEATWRRGLHRSLFDFEHFMTVNPGVPAAMPERGFCQ